MKKYIALIIPIRGLIVSGESSAVSPIPFLPVAGGGVTYSEEISKFLKKVETSRKVRAIIFEIDSPGGTPYASKEIADSIKKLKIISVAQIKEYGTSGAYWIASSCSKIVADPLSSIGGVGTRAERFDFSELARKIGIKVDTFSTGEYKGMGSPYSETSEKEKTFIGEQVSVFNQYFVQQIKENRKITDEKVLENITSGKPYLGREALMMGLIDYLGNGELALKVASELAGVHLRVEYSKFSRERESILSKLFKKML
ncbi:MAG: signal peptide peptidase SppA [Actinobacteria bacterium]|nr:signal peptide peptidase SppA [Actinomycetota bacterium]